MFVTYGAFTILWNLASEISGYKKGTIQDINTYRGISLVNHAYEIYFKGITNRFRPIGESVLSDQVSKNINCSVLSRVKL